MSATNLIVLTPAVAGIVIRYLMRRRLRSEAIADASLNIDIVQTFSYPKQNVDLIFILGIIFPIVIFILPESEVLDVRALFDIFAILVSLLLFFSWAYLRFYKITVNKGSIEYGSFRMSRIYLNEVTEIKYHWVNNGISLKLFSNGKKIALFEGGVSGFDNFARCVRARLPDSVHVETVGIASFS
jgi:hypothetical protein